MWGYNFQLVFKVEKKYCNFFVMITISGNLTSISCLLSINLQNLNHHYNNTRKHKSPKNRKSCYIIWHKAYSVQPHTKTNTKGNKVWKPRQLWGTIDLGS